MGKDFDRFDSVIFCYIVYFTFRLQQQPVKYSEISEPHAQLQDHLTPSVIQKAKTKEYMEMCNVQQQHMKPSYDHLNGQQTYPDANVHPHTQYLNKDSQVSMKSNKFNTPFTVKFHELDFHLTLYF